MDITIEDCLINTEGLDLTHLLDDWNELVDDSYKPILITVLGDAFLKNSEGKIFFLDTISYKLIEIAKNVDDFFELLDNYDNVIVWFLIDLVAEIKESGMSLQRSQCYDFMKPIILGGTYTLDNIEPMDLITKFSVLGQIHKQLMVLEKTLKPGEKVKLNFVMKDNSSDVKSNDKKD